jgi:hypothetical protein
MREQLHGLVRTCIDQLVDIQQRLKKGRRSLVSKSSDFSITEHLKAYESLKMLRLSKDTLQRLRQQYKWDVTFKPGLAPFCDMGQTEDKCRLQAIDALFDSLTV